ncbi:hypothetical protein FWD07_00960 [Candidatus Saccharibacteria bacterium]|nr:hypothetical protein [Candidatus Saccharibacteria bacterium]
MADFAKLTRSRSILSEVTYITLNLLLAAVVTFMIIITNSPIISITLVILSKWRIFAVRPRYWFANVKSNMVDFIVGLSFAFIIFTAYSDYLSFTLIILTALYAGWLLFIKPRSSTIMMEIQAATALFLGTIAATQALFIIEEVTFPTIASVFLVVTSFVIGYSVARHILLAGSETGISFMSSIFGLFIAQLAWISYHWLVSYSVIGTTLIIPQLSIISTLIGFSVLAVYKSYTNHDGRVRLSDVFVPILFSLLIIVIMLIGFSDPVIF